MEDDNTDGRIVPEIVFSGADNLRAQREAAIKVKENVIFEYFSPHESVLMKIQRLLVWDRPKLSAAVFLCINCAVWLAAKSNYSVLFLLALTGISILTAETFYHSVWPDMKVRPPTPLEDQWTPLYPNLVPIRDICHNMAEVWQTGQESNVQFWEFRKTHPGKFCITVCIVCLILMLIGQKFSGAFISMFITSCFLLLPAVFHNDLHKHAFSRVSPYLNQLEDSMETTVQKGKKNKRRRSPRHRASSSKDDCSSSDSDIAEFMPSPGPSLDAAFAHANAPYNSTPGSSSRASPILGLVGGLMPRGPSLEMTDDDILTENENSFAMGELPAFDDHMLDFSDGRTRRHKPGPRVETEILYKRADDTSPEDPGIPKTWDREETGDFGDVSSSTDDGRFDQELTGEDFEESALKNDSGLIDDILSGNNSVLHRNSNDEMDSTMEDNQLSESNEPAQQPHFASRTAADLLSQTVASVSAFISPRKDLNMKDEAPIASRTRSHSAQPSSLEPDLSEYEVLDQDELDNTHNSRQEAANSSKESSFSEYFSSFFGSKNK